MENLERITHFVDSEIMKELHFDDFDAWGDYI